MNHEKFNLDRIIDEIGENLWSPLNITNLNDHVMRVSIVKGEYHWHSHNDDEFFLVHKGQLKIETEQKTFILNEGEGIVIPKGVKHKPSAQKRTIIIIIEPERVVSEGN